ncbi:MAG: DUF4381 domain-containing protein [Gammaproteobacteria bacterium]|nr:DUF4381 domain-containing protein [Gammaproteobacteria bacterium]
MTEEELIQSLQDIVAPPEPAWWLVAPGYLLAFGLIIGIVIAGIFFVRYRKLNRLAVLADTEFQHIRCAYLRDNDARRLAMELSRWLRQVSILTFPDQQPEGFTGETWLKFLDQGLGSNHFSEGIGKIFGGAIYSEHIKSDANQLVALCDSWLCAVKPRLLKRGTS